MRWFFWAPKAYVKTDGQFYALIFFSFILTYGIVILCMHGSTRTQGYKPFLHDQPNWTEYEISTAYKSKNAEK